MMSDLSRTTQRPSAGARPAAVITILLLMLVASINVLPAESDPAHMHVVIGGTDREQAHALATHLALMRLHPELVGRDHPPAHTAHPGGSCLDESDDQAHVLLIRVGDVLGMAVFGGGNPLAATAAPVFVPPLDLAGPLSLPAHVAMLDPPLPLPEPPPRAS